MGKYLYMFKSDLKTGLRISAGLSLVLFVTLAICGCSEVSQTENTTNGNSDSESANTKPPLGGISAEDGGPAGSDGPYQASVVGKGPVRFTRSNDLEASLKDASLGKVFLEYAPVGDGVGSEIEVPEEAMLYLNRFFRYRLRFSFRSPNSAQEQVQGDRDLIDESESTKRALSEIKIDAPDGKRNISFLEVSALISFVNKTAIKAVGKKEK